MSSATATTRRRIGRLRLRSQSLSPRQTQGSAPADLVRWMTAMQAQDFPAAKWAVGLSVPGATEADVEAALADGIVVRSWPFRGTLHFVAAEDLHWMLGLSRDRMVRRAASVFAREGLTSRLLDRAGAAAQEALAGGRALSRDEIYDVLASTGVPREGQARYHTVWFLCQQGLLCLGPPRGKAQAFVLLEEWVPRPRRLDRDEALAELALRYFHSHGPATVHDLAWWSSLTLTDARRGLDGVSPQLTRLELDGADYFLSPDLPGATRPAGVRLLPGFDEYLLGYTDRSAGLADEHGPLVFPGKNGIFLPTIVADGAVIGTWRRTRAGGRIAFDYQPFQPMSPALRAAADEEARRYAHFSGLEARLPA